jgi:hypothetical protein
VDESRLQLKLANMKRLFIVLLITFAASFTGCYYDNEERLYPQVASGCDLSNVTFSGSVAPILQASCLNCHSNAAAAFSGGGLKLQNYTDVQAVANNGKLMGAVNHATGYSAMPLGGGKLTTCEISTLQTWIDNGTLNN